MWYPNPPFRWNLKDPSPRPLQCCPKLESLSQGNGEDAGSKRGWYCRKDGRRLKVAFRGRIEIVADFDEGITETWANRAGGKLRGLVAQRQAVLPYYGS